MGPGTAAVIAKPTVNIGTIEGGVGSAINMIPDTCKFSLDIRMPAGLTRDDVLPVIAAATEKYKLAASFELNVVEAASNPASVSPLDHPLLGLLIDNAHELAPEDPAPLAIPSMGATYCKHYRYAGIPAYIYAGSPRTSESFSRKSSKKICVWLTKETVAQVNESASIQEYLIVTKVHAAAVWDYLKSKGV